MASSSDIFLNTSHVAAIQVASLTRSIEETSIDAESVQSPEAVQKMSLGVKIAVMDGEELLPNTMIDREAQCEFESIAGSPVTLRNLERTICKTVFLGSQKCCLEMSLPVVQRRKLPNSCVLAQTRWSHAVYPGQAHGRLLAWESAEQADVSVSVSVAPLFNREALVARISFESSLWLRSGRLKPTA